MIIVNLSVISSQEVVKAQALELELGRDQKQVW